MPTISTKDYLLDKAKRRLTPSITNFPGLGTVERGCSGRDFPQKSMTAPPPGSDLKAVAGDAGLPILGHMIEMFRGGPDYLLHIYRKYGPLYYADSPVLPAVTALGPDAAQAIYSNRNKDFSQQGWVPVIGPFFHRGLMLLDFEEHMFHRRIMQEAFVRTRLVGYQEQVDKVVSQVIANDWVTNDPRFLMYPAMKELTLDIASMVFMGHEPGTRPRPRHQGQPRVHHDHARGQRDHPHRCAAVHVVARPAGAQAPRGVLRRSGSGNAAARRARIC